MNKSYFKWINNAQSIVITMFIVLFTASTASAQTVPSVKLKDLTGTTIDTGAFENDGNPIIICFWATWCSPCKRELNNYMDYYADWQEETGVKIIAVSIDDSRSTNRVGPYTMSSGWEYEILLDPAKEFARAMQVINVPHTFLVNGEGKIVWTHNNYAEGDEEELYEELLKLVD